MIFGQGISRTGELLDLGEEYNLLKKSGNWYEIDGNKIGNGREASKTYLKEHPEVAKDLEEKIKEKIKTE